MKEFKKLITRTAFLKLFISYSLILILFVGILFSSYYYNTVKYYQDEISVSTLNRLLLVENSIDSLFEEITRSALKVSSDRRINTIYEIDDLQGIKDTKVILELKDTLDILEEVEQINSAITSVYLYKPTSGLIYKSNGGIYPIDEFNDKAWLDELIENKYKKHLLAPRDAKSYKKDKFSVRVFSLVYSLGVYPNLEENMLIINISEQSLYKYISSIQDLKSGSVMLFDKDGNLFVSKKQENRILLDKSIEEIGKYLSSTNNRGYFNYTQGSEEFLITYSKGDRLTYTGVMPMAEIYAHMRTFKTTLFSITAILLLLGLLVIYYVSNKFYSPIKGIMKKLKMTEGMEATDDQDELQIISHSIEYIIEKNKEMREVSKKDTRQFNDIGIRNLINGYVIEDGAERFKLEQYQCIVLNIDDYEQFLNNYAASEQYYLKTFVMKAFEKILVGEGLVAYGLILEKEELLVLLNHNEENSLVLYQKLCDSQQKLIAQIGNELSVSIGVGEVYQNIENIPLSYKQALESIKYKFIIGKESIIFYKDLEMRVSEDTISYLIDRDKVILEALRINNIERIKIELEEMIIEIHNNENITYEGIMQRIYILISSTVSFLLNSNLRIEDIWGASYNIYHKVGEFETLDKLQAFLIVFFTSIGNYLQKEEDQGDSHLVRIIDYIDANYMLNHMSINKVSEATSLSYSYVRKIFKEAKGINITDYINELRIIKAKQMLLETELPIKEISIEVGYTNDRSFSRTFKNYENITPGDFRVRFKNKQ